MSPTTRSSDNLTTIVVVDEDNKINKNSSSSRIIKNWINPKKIRNLAKFKIFKNLVKFKNFKGHNFLSSATKLVYTQLRQVL